MPSKKSAASPPSRARSSRQTTPSSSPRTGKPAPETVDPRWLLKAGAAVLALGFVCAYISICILFYTKQWQLVLHPSRALAQTPAAEHLAFEPIRFAKDLTGKPELAAWWIPSDSTADPTVLMLHSGDGSMSDALPAAATLHQARLNLLLFDYRGFGKSAGDHPTEQSMRTDAQRAWEYLVRERKIPPSSVLVWGSGLGASLAVSLCEKHPEIPALVLESADGDTTTRVLRDERSRIVPVSLLFHEKFPLADPLHTLRTPKLILSFTHGSPPVDAERAGDPKMTLELPPNAPEAESMQAIRRFLDTYVPHPPSTL